ncbi:hypothetical protein Tco_0110114 [Tanacetum coccineum]
MVKIPRCMSWLDESDEPIGYLDMIKEKVDNPSPQSTPQVLPSFEECTPPVTYAEKIDETIGIPMEVEPLDHTKLEDLCDNRDLARICEVVVHQVSFIVPLFTLLLNWDGNDANDPEMF